MSQNFNEPLPELPLPRFYGDWPRRIQIDKATPQESAIRAARDAVESMGCHPLLTEAVVALGAALEKVADYLEMERPK